MVIIYVMVSIIWIRLKVTRINLDSMDIITEKPWKERKYHTHLGQAGTSCRVAESRKCANLQTRFAEPL